MKKMTFKLVVLSFLFLFLASATSMAARYPEGPIRIIHPYSAGGTGEYFFRALQRPLEKELGQSLLLEFAGGGATKIGTTKVIKADPDGYTLMLMAGEAWVSRCYSGVFDVKPWEQLVPLGKVASNPWVVLEVLADGPYKTFADLISEGKKKGKVTGGTTGTGGMANAVYKEIKRLTGLNIVEVPFAGSGETLTALLGGHIDMTTGQPSEVIDMIKAGKTRGLVVSTEKRLNFLPDVPTFKEVGLWEGAIEMWEGFWGPPNLPSDVVNTFTKALEKAVKDPGYIKGVQALQYNILEYRSPQRQLAELKRFDADWGETFRAVFKKQ